MTIAERQSNVEFIRIMAMVFIVLGHVVLHGTHDSLPGSEFIKAVTITGVNLFVLISGYWGIRLSFKSFFNIIGSVVFYSALSIIIAYILFEQSVSANQVIQIFFPLSRYNQYWFVSCYLMLMLLSPAINVVLESVSNRWYVYALVILAYISCVSGWWFENPINANGYSAFNMVFIYILGHGIGRFNLPSVLKPRTWFILYTIFTVVVFLMFYVAKGRASFYNNPFTILAAVSLFCLILNTNFHRRTINRIALCMFPVYLIQEGVVRKYLYTILYECGSKCNFLGGRYLALVGLYMAALFVVALIIEPVRKKMMTRPIMLLSGLFSYGLERVTGFIADMTKTYQ